MLFDWLKRRRRNAILKDPFPEQWRQIVATMVRHYAYLSAAEKTHLERMIQVFIAEKNFEGCNNLEMTDEVKVVIASQACLLLIGIEHDLYEKLDSILVYPSTVVIPEERFSVFTSSPLIARSETPILGQAFMRGPVILVWDSVKQNAKHPEHGHNVVFHEFAHIIDMYDGRADGTPLLQTRDTYRKWAVICTEEFEDLREKKAHGKKTFLDPYGATNESEFFAVTTEYFFDRPAEMKKKHARLYELFHLFYNQDTAAREELYRDQADEK